MTQWIEKALETFRFHRSRRLAHERWSLKQTAKSLGISEGAVSEDLKIARWYRSDKEKIASFDYAKDALKYIRDEEKKQIEEEKKRDLED